MIVLFIIPIAMLISGCSFEFVIPQPGYTDAFYYNEHSTSDFTTSSN